MRPCHVAEIGYLISSPDTSGHMGGKVVKEGGWHVLNREGCVWVQDSAVQTNHPTSHSVVHENHAQLLGSDIPECRDNSALELGNSVAAAETSQTLWETMAAILYTNPFGKDNIVSVPKLQGICKPEIEKKQCMTTSIYDLKYWE